jgi:hypothetical protein
MISWRIRLVQAVIDVYAFFVCVKYAAIKEKAHNPAVYFF